MLSSTSRKLRRRRSKLTFSAELLEPRAMMAGDTVAGLESTDQVIGRAQLETDHAVLIARESEFVGRDIHGGLPFRVTPVRGTDGELQEVDVAHIGGTPNGRGGAGGVYLVSAVGTGAEIQLSAWRANNANADPEHLSDANSISGRDVEVHPLDFSTSQFEAFLVSRIGNNGNLWLTSETINAAGNFTAHDTRGFGSNLKVDVIDHAVAHAPTSRGDRSTQVVTPVLVKTTSGELQLRIVSWQVQHDGLGVSGQKVSEPLDVDNLPVDGGGLSIHHSFAGIFEVNFTDASDRLVTRYVGVTDDGAVLDAGGGSSGRNFEGSSFSYNADEIATIRLNNHAFVAIAQQDDEVNATVWERRTTGCFFFLCDFEPNQIGDSKDDLSGNALGVSVPLPNLTHAYGTTPNTGDQFGSSVVSGDFNGDEFQDVAIGAPHEDVGGDANAGAVTILYGSADGLYSSPLSRTITQATPGLNGSADPGDLFGHALVAGDFNGDGRDDLAIGAPGESIEADGLQQVGIVHVLYGTTNGLSTSTDVILRQGTNGAAGISEAGDQFGWALTSGDFDNDGRDDLVVGIPFEDHNQLGYQDGGAVHVFYGSNDGIGTSNDESFHQNTAGMLGSTASGDEYGYSLATGDLNNDGRDDLVIGIPGKQFFGWEDAGSVHIVMGNNSGLGTNDRLVSQDGIVANSGKSLGDISDSTEAGDRFGAAVVLGDFNNDGFDDLAIGVPEEDHSGFNSAGKVHVLSGAASGITNLNEKLFHQDSNGVNSAAEIGGRFGYTLTTGEVHGDDYEDLLVGIPFQDHEVSNFVTYANTGGAVLLNGTLGGITGIGSDFIRQGVNGIDGSADPGDKFGFAVALTDLDGDGKDDAVIGVPGELVNKLSSEYSHAGQIHVVYGDEFGLSSSDETWVQGGTKHIRAKLADSGWESKFGVGGGELYESMPAGEILPEHAASVTKTMTLLLTVEALSMPNSSISLTDVVTISEKAGATGGSKMKGTLDGEEALLEPGDQITLEALLYGMVIPSGNRASVAIAEHVAVNVYGADEQDLDEPFNVFVEHMNERAEAIPLPDSRYGHPSGGSTTTPQDLITFWREAWKQSGFRKYASATSEYPNNPATTVNTDTPKEFTLVRNSSYIGHDGYKGGHGKVGSVKDKDGTTISAPICDQCHVGQATRGGHSLIVGIQQSANDTSNAKRLYNFGFETLFTPDRRGTNDFTTNIGGEVIVPGQRFMGVIDAIALDHVVGSSIVSAAIDNKQQLQLQLWTANVGTGGINLHGSTIRAIEDLAPGPDVTDRAVDVVRLPSTGKVLGDYVSGVVSKGNLRLDAWRVGANFVAPVPFDPPIQVGGGNTDDKPPGSRPTVLPGDADLNGHVNFSDFLIMSANFGKQVDAIFEEGDFNNDEAVDFTDFLILSAHFGEQA